jgi:hypothetical protein
MAKFRNDHPLGDLEVPALGRTIKAGETFEVPDSEAALYSAFTPVDKVAKTALAATVGAVDQLSDEPEQDKEATA